MRRRVLLCAALAVSASFAVPASPASALPLCPDQFQCDTFFYAGPNSDEVVGFQTTDCFGHVTRDGQRTQWARTIQSRCNPF